MNNQIHIHFFAYRVKGVLTCRPYLENVDFWIQFQQIYFGKSTNVALLNNNHIGNIIVKVKA